MNDDKLVAPINTYYNNFHHTYCYLNIELFADWHSTSHVFSQLKQKVKTGLQVMLPSNNHSLIALLKANDFQLKRRCFECVFTQNDLKEPLLASKSQLIKLEANNLDKCAQTYAKYYQQVHADISPLTASLADLIAAFLQASFA